MKILGIGANRFNPRDGVICSGITQILGQDFSQYVMIRDTAEQQLDDFLPNEQFDYLIYCGTPWLWDQMQFSPKYRNTMLAISAHPEAKVIFMGIGSCLYLNDIDSQIMRRESDQKMLRSTFAGTTVIVRDILAKEILDKAGVVASLLPCPSYFNKLKPSTKECNVMFYHAPRTGISSGYWSNERLEEYRDKFRAFNRNHNPQIVVCEKEEIEIAQELFQKPVHLISTPQETFQWCEKADKVLSGRVHNAVPAQLAGAEVELVPVDSRYLTIQPLGLFDPEVYRKLL